MDHFKRESERIHEDIQANKTHVMIRSICTPIDGVKIGKKMEYTDINEIAERFMELRAVFMNPDKNDQSILYSALDGIHIITEFYVIPLDSKLVEQTPLDIILGCAFEQNFDIRIKIKAIELFESLVEYAGSPFITMAFDLGFFDKVSMVLNQNIVILSEDSKVNPYELTSTVINVLCKISWTSNEIPNVIFNNVNLNLVVEIFKKFYYDASIYTSVWRLINSLSRVVDDNSMDFYIDFTLFSFSLSDELRDHDYALQLCSNLAESTRFLSSVIIAPNFFRILNKALEDEYHQMFLMVITIINQIHLTITDQPIDSLNYEKLLTKLACPNEDVSITAAKAIGNMLTLPHMIAYLLNLHVVQHFSFIFDAEYSYNARYETANGLINAFILASDDKEIFEKLVLDGAIKILVRIIIFDDREIVYRALSILDLILYQTIFDQEGTNVVEFEFKEYFNIDDFSDLMENSDEEISDLCHLLVNNHPEYFTIN